MLPDPHVEVEGDLKLEATFSVKMAFHFGSTSNIGFFSSHSTKFLRRGAFDPDNCKFEKQRINTTNKILIKFQTNLKNLLFYL
jgi:hypothetical protein